MTDECKTDGCQNEPGFDWEMCIECFKKWSHKKVIQVLKEKYGIDSTFDDYDRDTDDRNR